MARICSFCKREVNNDVCCDYCGTPLIFSEENKDADLNNLPNNEKKTLIVAQTTLQKDIFYNFVSKIKEKYKTSEIIIKDTICEATEQRQNEILDIAKRNDVVLVIGGSESSNTKNLYKIASEIKPSFYVEYKEDLDNLDLSSYKNSYTCFV